MKANFNPRITPKNDFFNPERHARHTGIFVGVVKQNNDAQTMGRLAVWIPELGGDPNDSTGWFVVSYASPFAGVTPPDAIIQNSTVMEGSQQSYGFWMVPPDLENQVLVCFVNGNTAMGFWFACLYQQSMNYMVPGIPVGVDPAQTKLANSSPVVVEYNKWSNENPDSPHRPIFRPLSNGLSVQGLYSDNIRGPSTTSAKREAPSKVFGFLTPRGNTIHIDDNEDNEFIRLRTRSGAQIMINETEGFIYMNSKNGNSWMELSDNGIDMYSRGPISMRSESAVNIKSDASFNLEADGNGNIRSGGNLTMQSTYNFDVAANGHFAMQTGGIISMQSPKDILVGSGGNLRLGSIGDLTMASSGQNIRSASDILDLPPTPAPVPQILQVNVPTPVSLPDIGGVGPTYNPGKRLSIVTRMPTHEPYHHKGNAPVNASTEYASPSVVDQTNADNPVLVVQPNAPAAAAPPVSTTVDQLDWLTTTVIAEAAPTPDQQAAVAQVVKNRMATYYSSDGTIKGTVLWRNQFDCYWYAGNGFQSPAGSKAVAEQRGLALMARYKANTSNWNKVRALCQKVMAGTQTGGDVYMKIRANDHAVLYLNPAATIAYNKSHGKHAPTYLPTWAIPSKLVGAIGGTRASNSQSFYLS